MPLYTVKIKNYTKVFTEIIYYATLYIDGVMSMKIDNPNDIKLKGRKRKIVYALDWNAQDYEDRLSCVTSLEHEGALQGLSPTQLNEVANYLLYSSNVECEVELKQPSKKPISYEDMVENGVADMAFHNAKYKNIYKTFKPYIDKEKDADIPGIQELWEEMEKIKKIYDYLDDCLKGRREKDFNNPMEINYVNHHYYKNWYIDLCLQQYTLKDMYKPVMQTQIQDYISLRDDGDLYFGVRVGEFVICEADDDVMIDLANPLHIYFLLKSYKSIKSQHNMSSIDDWYELYELLDRAIARTQFNDCIWDILEMKINGERNDVIGDYVREKYGVNYNDNYISTLFTKSISKKIAKSAIINARRDFHKTQKKKCPRCKEMKWEDEFFSFAKSCGYCLHKLNGTGRKIKLKG